jgi:hypothetical protein
VGRAPLDGGPYSFLVTLDNGPFAVAALPLPFTGEASAAYVYVVSQGSGSFSQTDVGTLVKIPVDGGASTTMASGLATPTSVAIDATNVYWVNSGYCPSDGGACTTGSVMTTSR